MGENHMMERAELHANDRGQTPPVGPIQKEFGVFDPSSFDFTKSPVAVVLQMPVHACEGCVEWEQHFLEGRKHGEVTGFSKYLLFSGGGQTEPNVKIYQNGQKVGSIFGASNIERAQFDRVVADVKEWAHKKDSTTMNSDLKQQLQALKAFKWKHLLPSTAWTTTFTHYVEAVMDLLGAHKYVLCWRIHNWIAATYKEKPASIMSDPFFETEVGDFTLNYGSK